MDATTTAKVGHSKVTRRPVGQAAGQPNGPSPQNPEQCAKGWFCELGGFCPTTHSCLVCKHYLHAICSAPKIEGSMKWSTLCLECNNAIGEVLGLDAPNSMLLWMKLKQALGCAPDSPGITAKQLKAKLKKIVREHNKKPPASPTRISKCKHGQHPSHP
jgi:hypothetical protein